MLSERRTTPALLVVSRLLAAAAAGISGYLLWVSVVQKGMPAGCGGGSGCADVLTSRWASVAGVPVSAPALVTYLAVLTLLFAGGPAALPARRQLVWNVLTILAAAILAAAIWFIGLQIVSLKSYCPWCLADHAIGIVLAVLILIQALRHGPTVDETDADLDDEDEACEDSSPRQTPAMLVCLAGMGVSATALLIGLQIAFVGAGPPVKRLAVDRNDDTGPGPARAVAVLGGRLKIEPHDMPVIGSPDAPKLLVVLFDYRCKYCRATHGYLNAIRRRQGDQIGIVLLPMPMEKSCNRHVDETEERFVGSCDIARMALAVWRADSRAFARFDAWLFEPEIPPSLEEARKFAETLVPAEKLSAALNEPWIDQQIQRNVDAWHDSQSDLIPVILSPGMAGIVGRPASEEALSEVLQRDLDLAPP